ncbi:S-layer homology domain-containing protein [Aquibacillus salsiterrae]|uniref:S-layer homology domain-containing protein n=1 Tax=Aquibacillus salsiterrae TaxID=2950439 RepID=A0A9X4AFF3_9BACI|nr:S-layer homology domain-containing protein [Aquibacillus salsiterrae]MDC3415973.1 S-layer homology domain-containing protein [Aquibacillus salsiterrae]
MFNKIAKKVMVISLSVSLAATVFASSVSAAVTFTDIKKGDSHFEAVNSLAAAGVIKGYPGGTFGPYNELQRQHGAVLFQKSLNLAIPTDYLSRLSKYYTDVDETNDYAEQIAAVTPDIFTGGGGAFRPVEKMTREQMATTMVKALGLKDNGKETTINLNNVSDSHKQNVKIFAQYGITNQLQDFKPRDPVTRAQFATFLQKSLLVAIPHSINLNSGITMFDRAVEITLNVSNPSNYQVFVDGKELLYKNGKFVGVVEATKTDEVKQSLVIIKK